MSRLFLFILWLIYFLFPFDIVPDVIPGLGWADDLLLLAVMYLLGWKNPKSGTGEKQGSFEQARRNGPYNGYDYRGSTRSNGTGTRENNMKDPYQILGVARTATPDEIKQAYRLQASRYHPDKVSHLGEEFQTLANEKFQDISWAYQQLMP